MTGVALDGDWLEQGRANRKVLIDVCSRAFDAAIAGFSASKDWPVPDRVERGGSVLYRYVCTDAEGERIVSHLESLAAAFGAGGEDSDYALKHPNVVADAFACRESAARGRERINCVDYAEGRFATLP